MLLVHGYLSTSLVQQISRRHAGVLAFFMHLATLQRDKQRKTHVNHMDQLLSVGLLHVRWDLRWVFLSERSEAIHEQGGFSAGHTLRGTLVAKAARESCPWHCYYI